MWLAYLIHGDKMLVSVQDTNNKAVDHLSIMLEEEVGKCKHYPNRTELDFWEGVLECYGSVLSLSGKPLTWGTVEVSQDIAKERLVGFYGDY